MAETDRIRVAYLFMKMAMGGVEELGQNYLRWLHPPFEAVICCLRMAGPLGERLQSEGLPIHSLGIAMSKRFSPSSVRALRRWLQLERIDVVHSFGYHENLYGRLAARPLRLPYFSGVHSVYTKVKPHRALLNRVLARWTDRVICCSDTAGIDAEKFDHVSRDKIAVLANAIDLQKFSPVGPPAGVREEIGLKEGEHLIGAVGSLREAKNHTALIEAVARLVEAGKPVRCVICGEGKLEPVLRKQIRELGMADRVHLLGVRRPIANVLRELDIFAMPSNWEGFGIAMIEAMACGIPVVASRVPGLEEVAGRDHPGLVSPGNLQELAATLLKFLEGPDRDALVEHQLLRVVPKYGHTEHMRRLTDLYRKALSERDPDAAEI